MFRFQLISPQPELRQAVKNNFIIYYLEMAAISAAILLFKTLILRDFISPRIINEIYCPNDVKKSDSVSSLS